MEHARKMVLVPQDSIGKLFGASETVNFQNYNKKYDSKNSKNIVTTQTPGSHLTRLDSEMSEILNSDEFDEHTKWTKYQQTLDYFSWFLQDIGMPLEFIGNTSLYKEAQKFNKRQANKSVSSPHTSFMDLRIDTPIHNSTLKPGNFTNNTSLESITDGDSTVINRNDVSDEDGSFLMTRRSTRQNTKKNIQIKKVKADG